MARSKKLCRLLKVCHYKQQVRKNYLERTFYEHLLKKINWTYCYFFGTLHQVCAKIKYNEENNFFNR